MDVVDEVAMFDTDRSLTGMQGEAYSTLDEARSANTYPSQLAERIMLDDGSVLGVYVYSNVVSVNRSGGWNDQSTAKTSDVIKNFFIVYDENRVST